MKNIKCKLAFHDWRDDCEKCARCGKTRNHTHDWSRDCEKCKCCKKENHKWNENGYRCSICGETNLQALTEDVARANMTALRMQLLDVSDFTDLDDYGLPKPSRLSYEEKRDKHLRNALQPVATKWGRSVDELLRILGK